MVSPPLSVAWGSSAGGEQELDDGGAALGAGLGEGRDAKAIQGVGPGAGAEEGGDEGGIVATDGPVEGRGAVGLGVIGVGAGGEELADGGGIGAFGGVGEEGRDRGRRGRRRGGRGRGASMGGAPEARSTRSKRSSISPALSTKESRVDADAIEQGQVEIGEVGRFA
jgi:hypothetical protein